MSSIYHTEPPTSGKVLLKTSHGEIDVELWPKEAPKACRNFVQLALEGYYDDTVFHRVIPKVLVQGGDPTGTGKGGESVYKDGKPFRDEIHSRIKFNHRGQVAMANSNEPNTNLSQFFLTLDRADWLDKKHTIFGKVTGSTIFNALRLGDCEVDSNDRPQDPPRLISVEVLVNPFDDVVPRATHLKQPKLSAKEKAAEAKAAKGKARGKAAAKKDFAVLSFGDEAEEEERSGGGGSSSAINTGMRSAHDVLEDERLKREKAYEQEEKEEGEGIAAGGGRGGSGSSGGGSGGGGGGSEDEGSSRRGMLKRQLSHIDSVSAAAEAGEGAEEDEDENGDVATGGDALAGKGEGGGSSGFMQRMKQQMADKRRRLEGGSGRRGAGGSGAGGAAAAAADGEGDGLEEGGEVDKLAELRGEKRAAAAAKAEEYERLREELRGKHTRARKVMAGEERSKYDAEKQAHDMLTPLQQMRQKYKARRQVQGSREEETLAKLAAFTSSIRNKVAAAKPAAANSGGDNDEKDPSSAPPAAATAAAAAPAAGKGKEAVAGARGSSKGEKEAYHGQVTEGALYEGEEDDSSWFAGKLKFTKHIDDEYRMGGGTKGSDGRDANDYEVIDERRKRRGNGASGGGGSAAGESERRMRGKEMGGKQGGDHWGSNRPPGAPGR